MELLIHLCGVESSADAVVQALCQSGFDVERSMEADPDDPTLVTVSAFRRRAEEGVVVEQDSPTDARDLDAAVVAAEPFGFVLRRYHHRTRPAPPDPTEVLAQEMAQLRAEIAAMKERT